MLNEWCTPLKCLRINFHNDIGSKEESLFVNLREILSNNNEEKD